MVSYLKIKGISDGQFPNHPASLMKKKFIIKLS